MSEENKAGSAPAPKTEDLGNIKAEFNRKLSNIEATNAQLQAQLAAMQQAAKPAATKAIEEDWFDKPAVAANRIKEEAKQEIRAEMQAQNKTAQRTNAVIGALVNDFPELNDTNHDLTKKAVEIYGTFSDEDKTSPVAYRAAVREAAMELGIQPKSKRKETAEDESFALSGGGSSSVTRENARAGKGKLDPATAEFAKIMGLDTSKPEVKERLIKKSGRNFGRYE